MKIQVRYFTTLRELAGRKDEEVELKEGCVLVDLIEKISLKYGEEAFNYLYVQKTHEIDPTIQFVINGVAAKKLNGFKTMLKKGDMVAIIPPIGGG